MPKNTCTQLDPKFIQGLTTDEIDDIFITRLLWGYQNFHDFSAYDITWNFIHYPGMDTWEKVNDKTYSMIQKIMDQGYVSCLTFDGLLTTSQQLDKHKDTVRAIISNENEIEELYAYLFEVTDKGRQYVERNYPKHQTIIYEIRRLEVNRDKDKARAENEDTE